MAAIQIPAHPQQVIDRQVVEGRAAWEADYVLECWRPCAPTPNISTLNTRSPSWPGRCRHGFRPIGNRGRP
jgi:hypothetical protein